MNEHALAVLSGLRDKRQCIFRCGITQQCLSVHIHRWVIYCANTTKPVKLWRHVITEKRFIWHRCREDIEKKKEEETIKIKYFLTNFHNYRKNEWNILFKLWFGNLSQINSIQQLQLALRIYWFDITWPMEKKATVSITGFSTIFTFRHPFSLSTIPWGDKHGLSLLEAQLVFLLAMLQSRC